MGEKIYDMIVVGGGPAGYSAALYGARSGLSVLVLEKMAAGGQMNNTDKIDNYPGFDEGIAGVELGGRMQKGALRFGAETKSAEVKAIDTHGAIKRVRTRREEFRGRTLVIATGAYPRLLDLPGETELKGRGLSYCATCDGMFYKDRIVAVYGGGNTAAEDALVLARLCTKVYLIHRRDALRATQIYQDAVLANPKIEVLWNSQITALQGADQLTAVELSNTRTLEKRVLPLDGLFIGIGRVPDTALVAGQVKLDNSGYIVADESTRTSVPGVFAAGDVRTKQLRQVVTAAADGAMAAWQAEQAILRSL